MPRTANSKKPVKGKSSPKPDIEKKKILITAALPYINAIPHLGNLVGSVLPADVFARYHRLRRNDVIYICGSDAHGTPIEVAAFKANTTPEAIAEKNHEVFQQLFRQFNIQFDHYGITHSDTNKKWTEYFFEKLKKNGFLKQIEQNAFYCPNDKAFRADRWVEGKCSLCQGLARGDQCNDCGNLLKPEEIIDPKCIVCNNPVKLKKTTHWFLDLPQFGGDLKTWISKQKQWPENVRNYSLSWLGNLQPRPITRDIKWGFSVPGMKDKVFYVWFDAPIGYVAFTEEWCKKNGQHVDDWWRGNAKIYQFLGKDNIIFHTIVFPSMLLGAKQDWKIPDYIAGAEYLVARGGVKFSKSKGTGLDMEMALKLRDQDYWRYYLVAVYPDTKDTEFSLEEFRRKINDELNDNIGNFAQRLLTFVKNNYNSKIPLAEVFSDKDLKMETKIKNHLNEAAQCYENVDLKGALKHVLELSKAANSYINDVEPWKLVKGSKGEKAVAASCVFVSAHVLKAISIMLHPVIPFSAEKIWHNLRLSSPSWDDAYEPLKPNHEIDLHGVLFKKIDDNEFNKMRESLGVKEGKPMVSIEEFEKLDLKVCKVLDAEKIKGSDKLLKLQVDTGTETRQIVSGIGNVYSPDEIKGKLVVAIVNLKPATIRGVESQGMVLAAVEKDKPVLLTLDKSVQPGANVL